MKKAKKIIALILAIAMSFSLLCSNVWATEVVTSDVSTEMTSEPVATEEADTSAETTEECETSVEVVEEDDTSEDIETSVNVVEEADAPAEATKEVDTSVEVVDTTENADTSEDATVETASDVDSGFSAKAVGDDDVSVPVGGSTTLAVKATSNYPDKITYQWYDGDWDEAIEGATTASYTVENVQKYTEYYCTVSDGYNTDDVDFYVNVDSGFSVAHVSDYNVFVPVGGNTTLVVEAKSNYPDKITYQWYDNNGDAIEGATTASYAVESVQKNLHYYCTVSDGYNTDDVDFYVNVDSGLSAERVGSGNVYVPLGENTTLAVKAKSNYQDKITYQWYDNNGDAIEGATTASYTVENVQKAISYKCEVSDGFNNTKDISFDIHVDSGFSVARVSDDDIYVSLGGSTTLAVKAKSNYQDKITYQWYNDGSKIEGATSPSYTVENVQKYIEYRCKVSDGYNTKYVYFDVYVDSGLSFECVGNYKIDADGYYNVYIPVGGNTTLAVKATSYYQDKIEYQWYIRGYEIYEATTASYTVNNVQEGTYYYCEISDGYNSEEIYFYVNVDSGFSAEAVGNKDVYVPVGGNTTLAVKATSNYQDKIEYQWYIRGYEIDEATSPSYTVENVQKYTYYYCKVDDGYNTEYIYFYVYADSGLSVEADGNYKVEADGDYNAYVELGGSTTLAVKATSYYPENLTYQWYDDNEDAIEGATTASCTVENVQKSKWRYCEVSDGYTTEKVYFNVYVGSVFSIEAVENYELNEYGNYDIYVEPGDSIKLAVTVASDYKDNITYQWYSYFLGANKIEGATTASYTVKNIQKYKAYLCEVSDGYNTKHVGFNIYIDTDKANSSNQTQPTQPTHTHSYESAVTTAPTCGTNGVRTYTCSCSASYTETIPATGNHVWNAGVVTTGATLKATGVKTYTCTVCGATQTEVTPKIKKTAVKYAVALSATSFKYNGKKQKPAVTVTINGTTVPKSEYTIKYSNKNSKKAGKYKITIKAKKKSKWLSGSVTKTYKIVK